MSRKRWAQRISSTASLSNRKSIWTFRSPRNSLTVNWKKHIHSMVPNRNCAGRMHIKRKRMIRLGLDLPKLNLCSAKDVYKTINVKSNSLLYYAAVTVPLWTNKDVVNLTDWICSSHYRNQHRKIADMGTCKGKDI